MAYTMDAPLTEFAGVLAGFASAFSALASALSALAGFVIALYTDIFVDLKYYVEGTVGSLDKLFLWIAPKLFSHFLLPLTICFFLFVLVQYIYNMVKVPFPTACEFEDLGFELLGCKNKGSFLSRARRFKAFFGAEPEIVAELWQALYFSYWLFFAGVRGPKPVHLLWALMFLRRYGTEETMAVLCGVCKKTFRKWSWFYATGIANLDNKYIKWENRLARHNNERALVTIDGVDFEIMEQFPFDSKWYSHKFNGPGLRYEIGICIKTGWVVSFSGPFECGTWPDLNIFRATLKRCLGPCEMVVADSGYQGDPRIITSRKHKGFEHQFVMNVARARHETFNSRLKAWGILKQIFRHDINKQHIAFRSCIVIEQLHIKEGYTLFDVAVLDDHIHFD